MKKAILLFILFISSFSSSFCQIMFERNYDTLGFYYANSVKQTLDGGYVFCGSSYNLSSAQDAEIVKTDEYGNVVWARTYGGPSTDGAITMEVTADSNYFVFGIKNLVSATQSDIWILKLDNNGDTVFTKNIDLGPGSNYVKGSTKTFDGGFALTGYTNSRGQGYNDVSLVKLNSAGDTSWIKTYGGSQNDNGFSVSQNQDSGYIIVGITGSFNVQIGDFYIIRTDLNGDTLWTRTFGFTNSDFGAAGKQTSDGGFIVAGTSWDTIAGHNDIYLVKYDSIGNLMWDKRLKQNVENVANNLIIKADGKIVVSGTIVNSGTLSDFYLVETDTNGDTLWTKTFGDPSHDETSYNMNTTSDGGFILSGTTSFNLSTKTMIVKTDSLGNLYNYITPLTYLPLFILYPNPAIDMVIIKNETWDNFQGFSFEVFDLFGSVVRSGVLNSSFYEIQLTGLESGVYFLKIFYHNQSIQSIKLILTP